jgi:rhodanese-related sulfurtransferase
MRGKKSKNDHRLPSIVVVALGLAVIVIWFKRRRDRDQLAHYSISAKELHTNLAAGPLTLIYDVRLPLDLLADPNIIPTARRVAPSELVADPNIIPRDRDIVVYCTCPGDETSRLVIAKARQQNFTRVKFLYGGLDAWKALGYPVDPYNEPFHLDTGSGPSLLH